MELQNNNRVFNLFKRLFNLFFINNHKLNHENLKAKDYSLVTSLERDKLQNKV